MSFKRIFVFIKKGSRLSPDNPIFFFVLLAPFLYTIIFQGVFGAFLQQKPVVAVFEKGNDTVISQLEQSKAIKLLKADSEDEVKNIIEEKKADIGMVFPENIKDRLKGEEEIVLTAFINGDSHARARTISVITVLDALRKVAPDSPRISFEQVSIGEKKGLPLIQMIIPFLVIVVLTISSFMLPAAYIIQEKENKTISALLVTPTSTAEILVAFGFYGTFLSIVMALLILFLNVGFSQPIIPLLPPMILGSILLAEWGLLAGIFLKDMNSLMANVKLFGIILYAPAFFVLFPNWPEWIAKIFPTYYILDPVHRISAYGEGLSEIGLEMLILLAFVIASFIPLVFTSKRLRNIA